MIFSKIVAASAKSAPCYNKNIVSKVQSIPMITGWQNASFKDEAFERAFEAKLQKNNSMEKL